jgi:hypothetical protein
VGFIVHIDADNFAARNLPVLELGAVNLHHRVRIAEQRLGGGFDRPGLPDPVGPRRSSEPSGLPGNVIFAR